MLPVTVLLLAPLSGPTATAASGPVRRFTPRHPAPEQIAATPHDGTRLFLHAGLFDPTLEAPDFAAVGLSTRRTAGYALVQLQPGRLDARLEMERAGLEIVGYVPDNAYQVRLTPGASRALAGIDGIRWWGPWEAGYAVHSRLWPGSGDPTPEMTIHLFAGGRTDSVAAKLDASPSAVRTATKPAPRGASLRYAVPLSRRAAFVAEAAALPDVAWIEPYDPPRLHNNDAIGPVQSNAATSLAGTSCTTCTIFGHGITGTGQIVTVADSGNDSDMCFFRKSSAAGDVTDSEATTPPAVGTLSPGKKIIGYWVQPGATSYDNNAVCGSSSTSWHGTHTSGTAVGDNFANLSTAGAPGIDAGDGMAPNAQLLFQDVGDDTSGCLSGLADQYVLFQQALLGGARAHSNSYGSDSGGAYTGDAQASDRFLFDHEEMTIFFSAGNAGPGTNTIGSPGTSKNVVTVGALGHGNSTTVAGFSSRGPTDDGRTKPDIMAPGSSTISAGGDSSHSSNNCGLSSLSGTSMACPTVAGASALLREYFANGFYPSGTATPADAFEASAPLVKAVLLNGALPLGTGFGNQNYGWGRVFLDQNLYFAGDARKLRVWALPNPTGLTTGQSRSYTVTVGAGQELRVTLVWSDPEATLGVASSLVNNLNLSVTDGSSTWLGNVLDASGVSTTGGSADAINNVEQVRLVAPAAGTYTVTVSAPSVPGNGRPYTARQGFGLAASFATCASGVASAPTGLGAVPNAIAGVDLSFTPAGGSTTTQVYRAPGTCAAATGDFQYVGSAAGSTFTDDRAQGGLPYAYRVRGADGCGEGPASSCVTVTPTGRCDLVPSFSGLVSAGQSGSQCKILLGWAAATLACPSGGPVRYNVYRSIDASFTPDAGNRIATVTSTTYEDSVVSSGVTYFYVVRAEDSTTGGAGPNGGNEERNTKRLWTTFFGDPGSLGTWTDDGGDTAAYLSPDSLWQVTANEFQAGGRSYHSGTDIGEYPTGGLYPAGTCASLTTPALLLGTGSSLSFYSRYKLEPDYDGVVMEASTDGGGTWAVLTPSGGYPGNLAQPGNACAYDQGQPAFSGPAGASTALSPWTQRTVSLSPAFDGKTIRIRWRLTSDGGVEYRGFYLDTIAITNVKLPVPCGTTPNTAPTYTPAASLSRTQGSPATSATLGTAGDAETPSSLTAALQGAPAGVTVTGLAVTAGTVTGTVGAGCTAVAGNVAIRVSDPASLFADGTVPISITTNPAPTIGSYTGPPTLALGGSVNVPATVPPSDNGVITGLTATAPLFTGTLVASMTDGSVAISNAGPQGTYTVTVTATDNCGKTSTATFPLTVGPPPGARSLHTLTPCRIVDTRDAPGPVGGPALVPGGSRSFPVQGRCGVPATAICAALNVTVTDAAAGGNLRVYPAGGEVPGTSTINYSTGQTRANNAIVCLGTGGEISVLCDMPGPAGVNLIVDVVGWFE